MTLATVMIDPPTTLFCGGILAFISYKLLRTRGLDEVWRVGQLAGAWGFVYGLSVGWHFFNRTDWMFIYALDTTTLPLVPLYLVFLFVCAVWGALGGLSVALLIHLQKTAAAGVALAGAVTGFALLTFVTADQYLHMGTRAEYLAGTAKKVTEDANSVIAMNLSPAIFGIAAVGIIALQIRRMRVP